MVALTLAWHEAIFLTLQLSPGCQENSFRTAVWILQGVPKEDNQILPHWQGVFLVLELVLSIHIAKYIL